MNILVTIIAMIAAAYGSVSPALAHGAGESHEIAPDVLAGESSTSLASPDALAMEIIPNWHPIFVHFSVALLLTATMLFILGKLAPRTASWRTNCLAVARWNLSLGVAITVGTVLAGWYAFNTVGHDGHSHLAMLSHRLWALSTAAAFILLGAWSLVGRKREPHALFVMGLVVASGLLLVTGYKGGELVFRHGLGVMAMPEAESHDHQH